MVQRLALVALKVLGEPTRPWGSSSIAWKAWTCSTRPQVLAGAQQPSRSGAVDLVGFTTHRGCLWLLFLWQVGLVPS